MLARQLGSRRCRIGWLWANYIAFPFRQGCPHPQDASGSGQQAGRRAGAYLEHEPRGQVHAHSPAAALHRAVHCREGLHHHGRQGVLGGSKVCEQEVGGGQGRGGVLAQRQHSLPQSPPRELQLDRAGHRQAGSRQTAGGRQGPVPVSHRGCFASCCVPRLLGSGRRLGAPRHLRGLCWLQHKRSRVRCGAAPGQAGARAAPSGTYSWPVSLHSTGSPWRRARSWA